MSSSSCHSVFGANDGFAAALRPDVIGRNANGGLGLFLGIRLFGELFYSVVWERA